jgi:hypothetical protein
VQDRFADRVLAGDSGFEREHLIVQLRDALLHVVDELLYPCFCHVILP